MSSGLAVRSLGKPYFAFVQKQLTNMNALGVGSDFSITVEAKINVLPVASAGGGQAEFHPLFSWCDFRPGGDTRLAVGVTPSGRAVAMTFAGEKAFSAPGLVNPSGVFVEFRADRIGDDIELYINGKYVARTTTAGTPINTGNIGQFMLFNDMKGVSRTDATVSYVKLIHEDGQWEWLITEKHGVTLAGVEGGTVPSIDPTLTADWWNPSIFPLLWGDVPTAPPYSGFRFERVQPWERRPEPVMVWNKR